MVGQKYMRKQEKVTTRIQVSLLCGMLILSACTGGRLPSPAAIANSTIEHSEATLADSDYTFGIGDEIQVKFYYHSDLDETAVIRSDGKISLQIVGDVLALGITPSNLAEQLREQYTEAGLRNPTITVMLRKSGGQKVFVGGEVATPKMISYNGKLSLTQALFEAGGFKPTAQRKNIVLLRENGQGKPLGLTVSFDDVLQQQQDIPLRPYDVVFVPKSAIARVNEFVEQYIVKVLPFSINAGFQYLLGSTTVP